MRDQGAGLDVHDTEPPDPDNRLAGLRNVVVTLHVAAATADALRSKMRFIAQNVARFLATPRRQR